MNVLIIADDELFHRTLPEKKADLLVSCGDLSDDAILRAAATCSCAQTLAVKGNHDSSANFPSPIMDMHCRIFNHGGIRLGGFGGAWKYKPRGHHLFEQSEVEMALSEFPKVDVFIAHNSPWRIHERDDEVHAGFAAFTNYIEKHQPAFFLHGHQHRQQETLIGVTRVIGTFGFRWLTIPE